MRMLQWMCGDTKKDKIRNERENISKSSTKKITPKRLKWYRHVNRKGEGHVLRRMLYAPVQGKRRRGRQNTRWKGSCMESVGLKEDSGGCTEQNKVEE